MMDRDLARLQLESKSLGWGLLLTLVFGGLGLFYLGLFWGLFGLVVEGTLWLVSFLTGGLLSFLIAGWHVLCVIIAYLVIKRHNQRLWSSL